MLFCFIPRNLIFFDENKYLTKPVMFLILAHGIGDYEMKIANDEDIDYFINLFKQAYKEKL